MSSTIFAVAPFGVEADHPRNSDLLLQCISGCRLRSAIDGSKPAVDAKTGDLTTPLDQARTLASFPKLPGMQVHVNPEKCTYAIVDPLHNNEELLRRVEKYFQAREGVKPTGRMNGVAPKTGKLDVHQMKSLCRELHNLVTSGEAKIVQGIGMLPKIEDIEEMPGRFMLNPGSMVPNTQPRYEDDLPGWVATLSHNGG